ncbi:MAG TPA: T9SS type A sorting domain-containing protein, partial [Chitinophagales bacterium]|nr:T9SS type A sorting domain-containing protein [Chitinophagales bacterium]
VAAAAGQHFVMILTNEGAVFTCGNNSDGQLGDGTVENKSLAIGVDGLSGILEIAAGGKTAVVLDNDGNMFAWGDNIVGQIGDNTLSDKWTPTLVTSACSMLLATNDLTESQSGFDVYPNPADDYLFIKHTDVNNHELQLIDINGKIISSIISNNSTNKIDVSYLSAGIYLLRDPNYANAITIIVE